MNHSVIRHVRWFSSSRSKRGKSRVRLSRKWSIWQRQPKQEHVKHVFTSVHNLRGHCTRTEVIFLKKGKICHRQLSIQNNVNVSLKPRRLTFVIKASTLDQPYLKPSKCSLLFWIRSHAIFARCLQSPAVYSFVSRFR